MERALFLRERLNKSYSVAAYFWGRSFAEFPFHIALPILTTSILYYAIGLNSSVERFFMLSKYLILFFRLYPNTHILVWSCLGSVDVHHNSQS